MHFVPPVIAHRGARASAPENTLAAFEAARQDGATWIETDIKLTADGVPILMHDDTLERTTNGHGAVADTTWAEMQAFDAGSWFGPAYAGSRIPSLAELLAFALEFGIRLNIELKPCPGRARVTTMVALIEIAKLGSDAMPPPLISSFDIEALTIAAQLHPDWPRGLLLDQWRDDWREVMTVTRATTLHLNAKMLTTERLRALRETGVPLLAYTVNDALRARELLTGGVRAVFSDNPGEMIRNLSLPGVAFTETRGVVR
jgi:glycerophosphoryl diester phosphodiesterase